MLKGVLLLLAGAGFLRWVDPEIETALSPLLDTLHLSLHTRLLHAATLHVQALQPHSLLMMGLISLTYATLLFVEGFGLWIEAPPRPMALTALPLPFRTAAPPG